MSNDHGSLTASLGQAFNWRILFAVIVGCGAGGVIRHAFQVVFSLLFPGVAVGTILVNLIGSFLAGIVLPQLTSMSPIMRGFFLTGFLGGLTTMSSFALDVHLFTDNRKFVYGIFYWACGAVGCVLVCAIGARLSRTFFI